MDLKSTVNELFENDPPGKFIVAEVLPYIKQKGVVVSNWWIKPTVNYSDVFMRCSFF